MKVHIYRPPLFGFNLRKFKFYNEDGNLLSYANEDSEVIINDAPGVIKTKVDWFIGKSEKLEGKEVYLISFFEQTSFLQWFIPSGFKNYFKFKEVSKEEYEASIETKRPDLNLRTEVSKRKSVVSRLISFAMLALVATLFYFTDYSSHQFQIEEVDFIRVIGLIAGFSSIVNLIWNFDRFSSPYPRGFFVMLLSVFLLWQFDVSSQFDYTILLIPAFAAIGILSVYSFGNKLG